MPVSCTMITLVVSEYNLARDWFVDRLGFQVIADEVLEETNKDGTCKRWLVIAASGGGVRLLLAQASNQDELEIIGQQAGGRVFGFMETDDFERDYRAWRNLGVKFLEAPRDERYGTVAVFVDVCGNRWDLIEHKPA